MIGKVVLLAALPWVGFAQTKWQSAFASADYGLALFDQALPVYQESPKGSTIYVYGLNWRLKAGTEWSMGSLRSMQVSVGYLQSFANAGEINGNDPDPNNIKLQSIPLQAVLKWYGFSSYEVGVRRYVAMGAGIQLNRMVGVAAPENPMVMTSSAPGGIRPDASVMVGAGSMRHFGKKWYVDMGYSLQLGTELLAGVNQSGTDAFPTAAYKRLGMAQLFLFHFRVGYLVKGRNARTNKPLKEFGA
jgi:hypothetical protein